MARSYTYSPEGEDRGNIVPIVQRPVRWVSGMIAAIEIEQDNPGITTWNLSRLAGLEADLKLRDFDETHTVPAQDPEWARIAEGLQSLSIMQSAPYGE